MFQSYSSRLPITPFYSVLKDENKAINNIFV